MPATLNSEMQRDIELLQSLDAKGVIVLQAMSPTCLRIEREGRPACFVSLLTGAVTQGGKVTKVKGVQAALTLLGVAA